MSNRKQIKDKVYFEMAKAISKLSRDERNKVGAIIVDEEGKIISSGYNGPPSSFNDTFIDFSGKLFPVEFDIPLFSSNMTKLFSYEELNDIKSDYTDNFFTVFIKDFKKSPFMLHAEMNAILTVDDRSRLKKSTMYITHVPCDICARLIAQCGIKKVKTLNNKAKSFKEFIFKTLAIFLKSNIELEVYTESELNMRE